MRSPVTPVLVPPVQGVAPASTPHPSTSRGAVTPGATAAPVAAAAASRLVRLTRAVRELATFGAVGLIAFVVDLVVFNVLRAGVLADHAVTAKAVSVVVATLVAWLGNRFVTFRTQRTRGRREAVREGVLFAATNAGGLAIAAGCLLVSHHVLGLTSTLADNVAGNGVGLVLGTAFRFAAYKTLVFRSPDARRTKEPTE
ncbi:GtrA family protein [Curtobacterium sp. MCJR17_055]|nr:GtrA family protein [Curtobacterium sp. MCBD17_029]PYY55227.1 GtrA family protein [Curtobacterium sp. MCPF17_015]PYY58348.1 GtrA family protein [Curtobacterium sp. MCJR17_055]